MIKKFLPLFNHIRGGVKMNYDQGSAKMKLWLTSRKKLLCIVSFLWVLVVFAVGISFAQDKYPSRAIEIHIAMGTGGTPDTLTRIYTDELGKILKVPIVVHNKPGASGTIGASFVAQARKDGYILLSNAGSGMTLAHQMLADVPFDTVRDFSPIGMIGASPVVAYVKGDSHLKSFDDMVAYAEKNPGKLSYGSVGTGSDTHFFMEQLQQSAKIKLSHVPFKGAVEVLPAVLGGHVDIGLTTMAGLINHLRAGTARALITGGEKRVPAFPSVPTVYEKGYKKFFINHWTGLFAPAGTPQVVLKIHASANETILKSNIYISRVESLGCTVNYLTPDEFKKFIQEEDAVAAVIAKQLK
jgi:tripartite-type tricarboxylate transporter receptor subunit TctC